MRSLNRKTNSIHSVIQNRQCMSCGMCKTACPMEAISMTYMDDGFFRPTINEAKCIDCGKCLQTCPAKHQEKTALLGSFTRLCLAHSTNVNVRYNATSGGVVNSLLRYLLDKNVVEAVLLTQYSPESVIEAAPKIVTKNTSCTLVEKTRDFASRYVSVPVLSELGNYVTQYKRVAVVGTPCQIKAINLWGGVHNVDIFKIGITCSGGISYKATEEYKRCQNLKISKIYYRGDGWPGKNCLLSADDKIEFGHQGSLFERMFSSQIFKNPGCRFCMDHFAESADISFCDFWNSQELANEKAGNSCVIIRSERLMNIFSKMQGEDGYVEVVRELDEKELVESQYQVLLAKKGDVREKRKYRFFTELIDTVFKYRLYKIFNIRIYRKFCSYYNRICRDSHI